MVIHMLPRTQPSASSDVEELSGAEFEQHCKQLSKWLLTVAVNQRELSGDEMLHLALVLREAAKWSADR